jgi:glycine hydroxymethyltransferase
MLRDRDVKVVRVRKSQLSAIQPLNKAKSTLSSRQYHAGLHTDLRNCDHAISELIDQEYQRHQNTLQLIAAEALCSRAVLAALGSIVQNKTTEGFVGKRYHGGCEVADAMETLAIDRAKQAFQAHYANVQPHSGTTANHIVLTALLNPGDRILSMSMEQGGHVSHGAPVSQAGTFYNIHHYSVNPKTYLLDYDAVEQLAREVRPQLIICGASAYTRTIDFARFRHIAGQVGAYLLADVSHIAGLIMAGLHPNPINEAHITTTSTYKPGGPRGGLILMGRDSNQEIAHNGTQRALCDLLDKATFPGVQGTPYLNNIAAKAVFFKETQSNAYKTRQWAVNENAKALAACLSDQGFDVLTGGTDNHMVLVNASTFKPGLTGIVAQQCLETCGIIVNMNRLPYDPKDQRITSGMRLGTPIVTRNGMQPEHMQTIAALLHGVLSAVQPTSDSEYTLDESIRDKTLAAVQRLCEQFPIW